MDVNIPQPKPEETPVHAMFLADTHLLGSKQGHWFDKLRRSVFYIKALQLLI